MIEQRYEPPVVIDLGEVVELTLGSGAADTADMNTARYY
ncbi:MAG: lasso RiPP family leader peptide-containing protein [Pseudonocardiaceae bacterium]